MRPRRSGELRAERLLVGVQEEDLLHVAFVYEGQLLPAVLQFLAREFSDPFFRLPLLRAVSVVHSAGVCVAMVERLVHLAPGARRLPPGQSGETVSDAEPPLGEDVD